MKRDLKLVVDPRRLSPELVRPDGFGGLRLATVEELATSVAVSDGQFLSPELIAEIEAV